MTYDVAIAGGGLIGLFVADSLERRGLRVVVLERGIVGGGASRGNAGEIVPEMVLPLASPGTILRTVATGWRPTSALHVSRRIPFATAVFLLRLALHAQPGRYARNADALQALAADGRDLFRRLDDAGVTLGANEKGFLYVYREAQRSRASRSRHLARGLTVGPALDAGALRELEPMLGPSARAGFLVEGLWSLDPSLLVDTLAAHLRARGVEIREHSEVVAVRETDEGVSMETPHGSVAAQHGVVAAGIWSVELCRALGTRLPLVAGKGYGFDIRPARPIERVIQFDEAHVVATPMGGRVRMAGTMEFDEDAERLNGGRVASLIAAVQGFVTGVDWSERTGEWVGPRPMTVDGMPYIGRLRDGGRVIVAAGHNMHGLSLGPATGELVAELVSDPRAPGAHPFSPVRLRRPTR